MACDHLLKIANDPTTNLEYDYNIFSQILRSTKSIVNSIDAISDGQQKMRPPSNVECFFG